MSLQSRLSDLITAIGTDIKQLKILRGPTYYRSGKWYTGRFQGQSGGLTLVLGTTYYLPFYVHKSQTFDQIGCGILTAVAASTVRLGIWDVSANGDWPGALILDAGTVATTTTGGKAISISQALTPGLKFLGVKADTAGLSLNRLLGSFDLPFGGAFTLLTAGSAGILLTETGVAGAFSNANATPTENFTSDLVRIGLRAA